MKPNGSLTLLLLKKIPQVAGAVAFTVCPEKSKANEAKKFQIESIEIHRAKCK